MNCSDDDCVGHHLKANSYELSCSCCEIQWPWTLSCRGHIKGRCLKRKQLSISINWMMWRRLNLTISKSAVLIAVDRFYESASRQCLFPRQANADAEVRAIFLSLCVGQHRSSPRVDVAASRTTLFMASNHRVKRLLLLMLSFACHFSWWRAGPLTTFWWRTGGGRWRPHVAFSFLLLRSLLRRLFVDISSGSHGLLMALCPICSSGTREPAKIHMGRTNIFQRKPKAIWDSETKTLNWPTVLERNDHFWPVERFLSSKFRLQDHV